MDKSREFEEQYTSMRLNFPEDEAKFKWLTMLLDAYAIVDKGISVAIYNEESRRNVRLACKEGCDNCCQTHNDIPVYPLELVGIYWFSIEKTTAPVRDIMKKQFTAYEKGKPCPFLINSLCSIHALRPIACRQFNVFSKPCDEGEDPYYTRRDDVLTPIEEYTNRAFSYMLSFYGVTDESEKSYVIKNNLIHTQVRVLQLLNWKELAQRMSEFDYRARAT